MRRFYLPLILLALLIFEGVALDFLPDSLTDGKWMIVPHWVLVYLVLITVFYDMERTYFSVLYALIFGLVIDIAYTSVIGVYMFIYALVVYLVHGLKKLLHTNFFVALLLVVIAVALVDTGLYIIYSFIGMTIFSWSEYLLVRLMPTVLANLLFFLILYPITKPKLAKWSTARFDQTNKL
ncbi:rod shape-determining protein MreD [Sediminibacillus massiliensis]|uniref:rod shape-determining protein MreD n=1 Tax=Sediminibacillus massiliensis TaxID=1926277 RepID=UPI0009886353|nr:rod shape-determining protein MreD [Sediminibacillus massiliensis]